MVRSIAFLEITRPLSYVAMMIPYKVVVDGQILGELHNGKTQTFEVSSGQRIIYAKQGWLVRSDVLVLDCAPNQIVRLEVTQNSLFRQLFLKLTGERISYGVNMKLKRKQL